MAWKMDLVSKGFPASYVQPSFSTVKLTKASLAWAAITVGRPSKDSVRLHGKWSIYEALFRWNMVLSSVDMSSLNGALSYSESFGALDATEKGGVNFFLGMAMAKLMAAKKLQVPWLHHFDNFRETSGHPVKMGSGKSKPDFVGLRPGDGSWHIIEAKARVGGLSNSTLEHAKSQAKRVMSVNQVPPATCIGTLLYPNKEDLKFKWIDPKADSDNGFSLEETRETWLEYYRLPWAIHKLDDEAKRSLHNLTGLQIDFDEMVVDEIEVLCSEDRDSDWQSARKRLTKWSASRDSQIDRKILDKLSDRHTFGDGVRITCGNDKLPVRQERTPE